MTIAIPLGYLVALLLIIAGVISSTDFLVNLPEDGTWITQLSQLLQIAWPAIAGTIILLLVQIVNQLKELSLAASKPAMQELPKKKKKPAIHSEEITPAEPAPEAAAPAFTPIPAAPAPEQAASYVPPTTVRTPLYPNSPIPGGGRVPQSQPHPHQQPQAEAAAPQPAAPQSATGGLRAPRKGENQGLNFFKVD